MRILIVMKGPNFIFLVMLLCSCRWDKGPEILETKKPCLPETVSLSKDLQPLFNYNCVGTYCHSGPTPPGVLVLDEGSSYSALQNGYVSVSNPKQSIIYQYMISTTSPMPPEGNLDSCKIDLVLRWIQQGAKNN